MRGEGIRQARDVLRMFIEELENTPFQDKLENVAVITFGYETKILHHRTCDYEEIKHCLDNVICRGPSPLSPSLILYVALHNSGSGRRVQFRRNDWTIPTRIILISDGRVTDFCEKPDEENDDWNNHKAETGRGKLYIQAQRLREKIYCVPVGDADRDFLGMLSAISNGKVVDIADVKQLGRFFPNVTYAATLHNEGQATEWRTVSNDDLKAICVASLGESTIRTDPDLEEFRADLAAQEQQSWPHRIQIWCIVHACSEKKALISDVHEQYETIKEILEGGISKPCDDVSDDSSDEEENDENPEMPPLGSRVRRGPDWRWGNQDTCGVGTVTAHKSNGWCNVLWDNGSSYSYRFGGDNSIDLVVVDEPKFLNDEDDVCVGCLVTRGKDWKWGDQDGGEGSVGVVYRYNRREVYVRWPNGHRGNYRFNHNGKRDVKLSDANCFRSRAVKSKDKQMQKLHVDEEIQRRTVFDRRTYSIEKR